MQEGTLSITAASVMSVDGVSTFSPNQTSPVCPSTAGTLTMKEEPGPAPWGIVTAICWPEGAITVSVCLKDAKQKVSEDISHKE
jgi:hypothetical protein